MGITRSGHGVRSDIRLPSLPLIISEGSGAIRPFFAFLKSSSNGSSLSNYLIGSFGCGSSGFALILRLQECRHHHVSSDDQG